MPSPTEGKGIGMNNWLIMAWLGQQVRLGQQVPPQVLLVS